MDVPTKLSKMTVRSILKLCKIYDATPTPPTKRKTQLIDFLLENLVPIPDFLENLNKIYYNDTKTIHTKISYRNDGVYKFRYNLVEPCAHPHVQFSHIKYFYIFPTLNKIKFTRARDSSNDIYTGKLDFDIIYIPDFLSVVDLFIFKGLYKNINQALSNCTSREIITHLPKDITKIVSTFLFLY